MNFPIVTGPIITGVITAAGIAWSITLAVYHQQPKPAEQSAYQQQIEESTSALHKGDKLSVAVPPPVSPQLNVEERPMPPRELPSDRRHRASNICERTGGWKVVTRHGKSWHCRYKEG